MVAYCYSSTVPNPAQIQIKSNYKSNTAILERRVMHAPPLHLFRELLLDDEEDLRTDIAKTEEQFGLDEFLMRDNRLCVIKFYVPFCKACQALRSKFRKLATERGDRTNAAGDIVWRGDVQFGEVEYSGNVKLCKSLSIKTFPSVFIFRGGGGGGGDGNADRLLSEIVCKQTAIQDIIAEMDHLILYLTVES